MASLELVPDALDEALGPFLARARAAPWPTDAAQLARVVYQSCYLGAGAGWRTAARDDPLLVDRFARDLAQAAGGRVIEGPTHAHDPVGGWFHAFGARRPPAGTSRVRLYWAVAPEGAARLVRALPRALDAAGVPHQLKVLLDPQAYRRPDAAVLYLPRASWSQAVPALAQAHRDLAMHLRDATPAFTRRLAAGLALAEDPGGEESFGQHRSRLVAEALLGEGSEPMARVRSRFAAEGLRPDAPHLHGSVQDSYAMEALEDWRAPAWRAEDALAESFAIADDLCATALTRADGACTWVVREERDPSESGARRPMVEPLGGKVYAGTAGIALFLARVHALSGQREHARVALAAARHAMMRAQADAEGPSRFGVYEGALGAAWAAVQVGDALGEPDLTAEGHALVRRLALDASGPVAFDVISGCAGAIPVLLSLRTQEADALADALGAALLAGAEGDDAQASWPTLPRAARNLAGFSHGASGVAWALDLLARTRGDAAMANAAARGFAHERAAFLPAAGNWADYRRAPGPDGEQPHLTVWCHGAPGVGVAHALAAEGDPRRREAARVALATTRREVASLLRQPGANQSLCHGVLGVAACAWLIEEALGLPEAGRTAREAAAAGVARYGASSGFARWPTGTPGCPSPTLMRGLAGIGHFLLRTARPRLTPCVLVPGLTPARDRAQGPP